MKKSEYVAALRELADFLEKREFPDSWKSSYGSDESYPNVYLSLFTYNKDDFSNFARMLGSFEKDASDSYLSCTRKLDNSMIIVHGYRDRICERVKVGTKIVPATEAKLIEAVPEHEEDIYEWKCPESFLDLKKEEINV